MEHCEVLHLNKLLYKQTISQWSETSWCSGDITFIWTSSLFMINDKPMSRNKQIINSAPAMEFVRFFFSASAMEFGVVFFLTNNQWHSLIPSITALKKKFCVKHKCNSSMLSIHLLYNITITHDAIQAHSHLKTYKTRTPAFWGYPPPPHDYPYHWVILDPKLKEDKVKVTNLQKFAKISNFETGITRDTPSLVAW